jgi:hypothetical protein
MAAVSAASTDGILHWSVEFNHSTRKKLEPGQSILTSMIDGVLLQQQQQYQQEEQQKRKDQQQTRR